MEPDAPRTLVARTGWVVLTAFLAELVVVAGVGNQAVTNAMNDYLAAPGRQFADYSRGAIDAMLTFHWRFAPRPAESTHEWAAQFLLLAVLFGLTALGVWAACRGTVTFVRVLVTVWAIVAAVTPLAIMARNLVVIPSAPGPLESRVGQSVYYYPLFGTAVVAGVVLGFVVGLVTALVARLTRRPVRVGTVGPAPYDPRDHYLEERFGDDGDDAQHTTQIPRVADGERTTQLPPWPARDEQR
jgi:hypothetical protein